MAIDFGSLVKGVDSTLLSLGLYTDVTFVDTKNDPESYDPIKGEFDLSSSTTYNFKAVSLTEGNMNQKGLQSNATLTGNSYGITQSLVVVPTQIKFNLKVDQIFTIGNVGWIVEAFELAPQDTVYTIMLRRK